MRGQRDGSNERLQHMFLCSEIRKIIFKSSAIPLPIWRSVEMQVFSTGLINHTEELMVGQNSVNV